MTKISKYIFIVIILFGILGPISSLQAQTTVTRRCTTSDFEKVVEGNPPREVLKKKASSRCDESDLYILLEKLPGTDKIDVANPNALGDYLNIMIKIVIGLAAVLAVFMIFLGGIQYMTSEVISSKEDGKNRIRNAIFGLLIALGAYTILYTINPDLLNSNLDSMKEVVLETQDEPEVGVSGKTITVDGKTITACKEEDMVSMTLFGHPGVMVHKEIKANLERVNAGWVATPEERRYKVSTVEGYVCREVTNKPGYWSSHAFGLALDINASTNPYQKNKSTPMVTDLNSSIQAINFKNKLIGEGWGWGGSWTSLKDPMHFSKIPPAEQGNGKLN